MPKPVEIALAVFAGIAIPFLIVWAAPFTGGVWTWLYRPDGTLHALLSTIILTAIFLAGGYAAFLLREWRRTFYSLLEITFGVATAIGSGYALNGGFDGTPPADPFGLYATLIGGLYVLVRGFDNFDKAVREDGDLEGLRSKWEGALPKNESI